MNRFVVCPEPLAAEAGAEILRAGGSAVDAAIATAYSQAVVSPAMTSIGGSGVMNIFHAPSRRHVILDFVGRAGSLAREDMYVGRPDTERSVGYGSIAIPTFVRGTGSAFRLFGSGRVAWADLLAPAIRQAELGFVVYPYMHQYWRATDPVQQTRMPFDGYRMLTTTPACAAIFTVGSRVHALGERIVQPDLARTLRRLAVEGPDAFYTGQLGERMVEDLRAHGGIVTASDLAECTVEPTAPVLGTYRGVTVATDRFPNIGSFLIEALNILECDDVRSLGPASPRYYDRIAAALHAAFVDRAAASEATPGSEHDPESLISKAHAQQRARAARGQPGAVGSRTSTAGTTHVSTFDAEGSAVSFTHSIGTGSGVVTPGLGFMYNNQMHAYDPRPGRRNSVAPRGAAVGGGGPSIVLQGGRVRAVLGSPHGYRKVSAMAHVLVSLLDFGATAAAAVASPRIHCEADPWTLIEDVYFPLPLHLRSQLEALGYRLRFDLYGGRVCLIAVDPASGHAAAGSDPRGGGGLAEV